MNISTKNKYGIAVKKWCPTCCKYEDCLTLAEPLMKSRAVEIKKNSKEKMTGEEFTALEDSLLREWKNNACPEYSISHRFDVAGKGGGKLRYFDGLRPQETEDGRTVLKSKYKDWLAVQIDRYMDWNHKSH